MDKILYFCVNDGSDMRTFKEVKTLSKCFDVIYLGIGNEKYSFCKEYCTEFHLIKGKIKSPISLLKLLIALVKLRLKHCFTSIHLQEEQLLIIAYPFLFKSNVVLDIFDSIFLKKNISKDNMLLIKKILYYLPNRIIVTDENRLGLLPGFVRHKAVVVPNVPFFDKNIFHINKNKCNKIRLGLFGSLAENRGVQFAKNLLEYDPSKYEIIAAGWLSDEYSKNLISCDGVSYLGVMKQEHLLSYIAQNVDYIISIYPLSNLNNINASPNKIYDSIHTKTPIIMNDGIKVSKFINDNGIGLIISSNDTVQDIDLKLTESSFDNIFTEDLAISNSWCKFENLLIDLHKNKLN
jgi:hypothetical protein